MKFYLTYEYLLDRIVEGTATKKEIKRFKRWCKRDYKRLNPTPLF